MKQLVITPPKTADLVTTVIHFFRPPASSGWASIADMLRAACPPVADAATRSRLAAACSSAGSRHAAGAAKPESAVQPAASSYMAKALCQPPARGRCAYSANRRLASSRTSSANACAPRLRHVEGGPEAASRVGEEAPAAGASAAGPGNDGVLLDELLQCAFVQESWADVFAQRCQAARYGQTLARGPPS